MKILHLKVPVRNVSSQTKDNFAIKPETLGQFMKYCQEKLGGEFLVIASPCDPSLLSKEDVVYNFNMEQLSKEDLEKLLESK